jgi:hypothetical protein
MTTGDGSSSPGVTRTGFGSLEPGLFLSGSPKVLDG